MSRDRAPILLFSFSYLFYNASLGVMTPFLPLFLRGKGYSAVIIGLLLGVFQLAGVFGPVALGTLGQKTGRYRHVMSGSILVVLVLFAAAYFNTIPGIAFALIAPMGFLYRSHLSLIDSHASRVLHGFEANYGKARLAGSLGFVASAAVVQVTGWITASSLPSIVIGFGILAALYAIAAQFLPPPRERSHTELPGLSLGALGAFPGMFWVGILVVFLMIFAMSSHYQFFSLYVTDRFGIERVTGFWAIGPLAEAPFIFFSGYLIRRFRISSLLTVSLIAGTVRLFIYVLTPVVWPLYVVQVLHGFNFGTLHTSAVTFIRRQSPPQYRGLGIAIYTAIGFGLSGFIGSSVGGFIVEHLGYTWLYSIYGLLPLLAVGLVIFYRAQFDARVNLPDD